MNNGRLARCALALALFCLPAVAAGAGNAELAIRSGDTLLEGDRPGVVVSGLAPHERVTVHAYRVGRVTVHQDGTDKVIPVLFHAFAEFASDAHGSISVDTAVPLNGTYAGADGRGLLWSGVVAGRDPEPPAPAGLPDFAGEKPGTVHFLLERAGRIVQDKSIRFRVVNDGVSFTSVDMPGLVGVYAAPAGVTKAPAVIVLHGSEGGDFATAKYYAGRYASHGYATFALIYFAWPFAKIANVPSAFQNIPVEGIDRARSWLSAQPAADVTRLGLVGGSKGSEYALLAASVYPWIRAVVACVPSSLVWGSFGGAPTAAGWDPLRDSGFTLAQAPVPFVPYGDYAPVQAGTMTSAQMHVRDRAAASPERVAQAMIPVERSSAEMLLFGSGKDAVWPSLPMSEEIAARMQSHGKGARVETHLFPNAGHFICGTGDSPVRYTVNPDDAPGGGNTIADAQASGTVWDRTLAFLERTLKGPRTR